jgi:two-component system, cell cycle sensor histidine kinase and response regulator CckA
MVARNLAEHLARYRPELRVLYMSGHPRKAMVAKGLVPEDARFLSKPFTSRALLEAVRGVLDQPAA